MHIQIFLKKRVQTAPWHNGSLSHPAVRAWPHAPGVNSKLVFRVFQTPQSPFPFMAKACRREALEAAGISVKVTGRPLPCRDLHEKSSRVLSLILTRPLKQGHSRRKRLQSRAIPNRRTSMSPKPRTKPFVVARAPAPDGRQPPDSARGLPGRARGRGPGKRGEGRLEASWCDLVLCQDDAHAEPKSVPDWASFPKSSYPDAREPVSGVGEGFECVQSSQAKESVGAMWAEVTGRHCGTLWECMQYCSSRSVDAGPRQCPA